MKCSLLLVLFSLLRVLPSTEAAEVEALKSTITDVVVYSDRARVSREADLRLAKGSATYAFDKLPGWVDTGSVRLAFKNGNGRMVDVRVNKKYLSEPDNEDIKKAKKAVEELNGRVVALNDEFNVLAAEKEQIEETRVFAMEKLPKDAALKDIGIDEYAAVVKFISDSLRANSDARRTVEKERRTIEPELHALSRGLNELNQLTRLEESSVWVTIESDEAMPATLTLTYMLPGATWEPVHELRVEGVSPEEARFSSYAVVTQTSGEDWNSATLSFSTQSPREVMQIPVLKALLLGDRNAAVGPLGDYAAVDDSFQKANDVYQKQQMTWNLSLGNSAPILEDNWRRQSEVSGRIKTVFATLLKRGTTAHFAGMSSPIVRTDGHSVRVPIGEVTLQAELHLVAAPQASLNAVKTLKMSNSGKQPLLPGKISLYQDNAFIGMTDMEFAAESEAFSVFLGVADEIKISRVPDNEFCRISRGKRNRMQVAFDLTVENLSENIRRIDVTDQVPVSGDKDIDVDRIKIQPEVEPDSRGLVKWRIAVDPKEKKSMRIEYRVEYSPTVIRARASKLSEPGLPADMDMLENSNSALLMRIEDALF